MTSEKPAAGPNDTAGPLRWYIRNAFTYHPLLPLKNFVVMRIRPTLLASLTLLTCVFVDIASAQLRVVSPNGGEKFPVGGKTTIRWAGVPFDESVKIEYSFDGGTTWSTITDQAQGLQYIWTNIPNTVSDLCALKITAASESTVTDSILLLSSFVDNDLYGIFYAEFSPDESKVIGSSDRGKVFIWDSHTKELLHNITVETKLSFTGVLIEGARYSPDGSMFAVCSPVPDDDGQMIRIFDANTGTLIKEWYFLGMNYFTERPLNARCAWSPDGTKLLVCAQRWGVIFDVATTNILTRLAGYADSVHVGGGWNIEYRNMLDGEWTKDGKRVIGLSARPGSKAVVFNDALSGDTIYTRPAFPTNFSITHSIRLNEAETEYVMTASDTTAIFYDLATGTEQFSFRPYTSIVSWADYDRTGSRFLTTGGDNLGGPGWKYRLMIWDHSTKSLIRSYPYICSMSSGQFSKDGSRILVATGDGARIYQEPQVVPGDVATSAAMWSIVANNGAAVRVYIPYLQGNTGEVIHAPVIMEDAPLAFASGAGTVDLLVSYNSTMLAPIGATPSGSIANNIRTIPLNLTINPDDSILTVLDFIAALGNDSVTDLRITNLSTDEPTVTATSRDGSFKLLDVCNQGGPRLINPDGVAALRIDRRDGHTILSIDLIEEGLTFLDVTDAMGRRVWHWVGSDLSTTHREYLIEDIDLSSGRYFVCLHTPTISKVGSFEVTR